MEFVYSSRKFIHSEEYLQVHTKITKIQSTKETTKRENKPENNPTMIYTGNKQVSTIYSKGLGFARGTMVALLHRLGKQAATYGLASAYIGQTPPSFWAIPLPGKYNI